MQLASLIQNRNVFALGWAIWFLKNFIVFIRKRFRRNVNEPNLSICLIRGFEYCPQSLDLNVNETSAVVNEEQ